MTNSIHNTSLANLLDMLEVQAMRALRRCRDTLQSSAKTHYEVVHESIAFIVAFVLHLQQSPDELNEFLNDGYWDGKPQSPKEKNLIRLVAMYVVGAKQSNGALYQQSLEYTRVAKYFLDSDTDPEDVPGALGRKPIYKLLGELNRTQEVDDEAGAGQTRVGLKSVKANAITRTGVDQDDCDLNDDDDDRGCDDDRRSEDDEDDDLDTNTRAETSSDHFATTNLTRIREKSKRFPFKQDVELAVEAETFWKEMFSMREYDEMPLMIRRLPDQDGFAKFEISDLLERRDFRIVH